MKTIFSTQIRNISIAIAAVVMVFSVSSCSKKIPFSNSSVVPAAKGTVKVNKGKNGNYEIKIQLADLAKPDRLQPSRNVYVVWLTAPDNSTKNIGQIETSTSFFSNQHKSSFETLSPFKPVKVFITAEDNANISYPMNEVVLSTRNF